MGQYWDDDDVDGDHGGTQRFSSPARSLALNCRAYSSIPSQNAASSRTTGNIDGSRKDSIKAKQVGRFVDSTTSFD